MSRQVDLQKRAQWADRLERYRTSNMTVMAFCQAEGTSVNTFYYWVSKLFPVDSAAGNSGNGARAARRSESSPMATRRRRGSHTTPTDQRSASHRKDLSSSAAVPMVRLTLGSGAELAIPANCLEAIRCVVEAAGGSGLRTPQSSFQQVVLANR